MLQWPVHWLTLACSATLISLVPANRALQIPLTHSEFLSQTLGLPATHLPLVHESPVVHLLPSSQARPSVTVCVHLPVALSHLSSVQSSPSEQFFGVATQSLALQ